MHPKYQLYWGGGSPSPHVSAFVYPLRGIRLLPAFNIMNCYTELVCKKIEVSNLRLPNPLFLGVFKGGLPLISSLGGSDGDQLLI